MRSASSADRESDPGGKYTSLYSFKGTTRASDGALPVASLIDVNGMLYGTTYRGGASICGGDRRGQIGCGTVFKISPSGAESVVYSFKAATDGGGVGAGLIDVDGALYGTNYDGPNSPKPGNGSVFELSLSGKKRLLHVFKNTPDGAFPLAGLTDVDGALYGTTLYGGAHGDGIVFKISTAGAESVLHSFSGNNYRSKVDPDGVFPFAGLLNVNGVLYGTTSAGGNGFGTVFEISTAGEEHVVYSFAAPGNGDGAAPEAGLIELNGTLYGTTTAGGNGYGTVFEVSTSGNERVLYRFKGIAGGAGDGAAPEAGLLGVNGMLYGTTYAGGTHDCGTIFEVDSSGRERVLYSFEGNQHGASDGKNPRAQLLDLNGVLYGTTNFGGSYGFGTVFKLAL